jgi:type I restriction enzyme S subunit
MGKYTMGPLPDGWAWTTLDDACDVILGQSPPSSTYNTKGIGLPFYQGKAEFGRLYPRPVKWCSKPQKIAQAGDVLLSVRAPVGPTNLCREKSCIGRGLSALRPRDEIPSLYLFYFLRHVEPEWQGQATGTTFAAIRAKTLREQRMPLAPLAEQRRIVAAIETQFTRLDALEAALKRVQANLRRYEAAVLNAACEGRLVSPGDEKGPAPPHARELTPLPRGWAWVSLGELLLELKNGYFGGQPASAPPGVPILRISAVRPSSVSLADRRYLPQVEAEKVSTYRLQKGDLLFTRYNGNPALVAACGLVRQVDQLVLYPDKLIRVRVAPARVAPAYLEAFFATDLARRCVARRARTTAGQYGIAGRELKKIPIPLPPRAEQHRIVAEIERRLSAAAALKASVRANLRRAGRLRQALLGRAFEGRLVPQDPDDEPATALLERLRAGART